ncbi:MAG: ABC transporter ATP-binding protein [Leptospiraceae bacterium]|nr:ABC transporter ATP-binding protein [Leptospiraceae bacterium]
MLRLENVIKTYSNETETLTILNSINLEIQEGEFIAITGPSGSGKSTFLAVAAGLDSIDSGKIFLAGDEITHKKESELAKIRSEKIGFIFQNFQLVKNLNALENVSLPLIIQNKWKEKQIEEKAKSLLEKVSMQHRYTHFPSQLSGGEEQRVAIARAFITNPKVLFADEPTGNLDSKNSDTVMKLLIELNKTNGSTLVVVTHDPKVASLADRTLEMKDGIFLPSKKVASKKKSVKK